MSKFLRNSFEASEGGNPTTTPEAEAFNAVIGALPPFEPVFQKSYGFKGRAGEAALPIDYPDVLYELRKPIIGGPIKA